MAEPDIVLVTGASGFVANHLIKSLLAEGVYRVRGTVRNLQKTEKVSSYQAAIERDSSIAKKVSKVKLACHHCSSN